MCRKSHETHRNRLVKPIELQLGLIFSPQPWINLLQRCNALWDYKCILIHSQPWINLLQRCIMGLPSQQNASYRRWSHGQVNPTLTMRSHQRTFPPLTKDPRQTKSKRKHVCMRVCVHVCVNLALTLFLVLFVQSAVWRWNTHCCHIHSII